jgi:dTDP-4-amino-4,6-dideoxygalactose transaminase
VRREYCERIWETARALPGLRVPTVPEAVGHAGYKCYLFVEPSELAAGWDRDRILSAVLAHDVPCFSGSCSEVYLEKCFQDAGLVPEAPLTHARELSDTSLMFLVHPTLGDRHIDQTCHALEAVMAEATAQDTAARASG